ncbi:hypothetical protein DsansV1_C04g0037351 [Dioscorea sansibarensis]
MAQPSTLHCTSTVPAMPIIAEASRLIRSSTLSTFVRHSLHHRLWKYCSSTPLTKLLSCLFVLIAFGFFKVLLSDAVNQLFNTVTS